MYNQALAIREELGDRMAAATTMNNIAGVLVYQGELVEAARVYRESIAIKEAVGDRNGVAVSLNNVAEVLLYHGELAEAERNYSESLDIARAMGNRSAAAYALFGMAEVLLAKGDIALARANHEKAEALRSELGERSAVAESSVALAAISLEEGHASQAEALARRALDEFDGQKETDNAVLAGAVLVRALLDQARRDEAARTGESTGRLAAASQNRFIRLSGALAAAQVLGTSSRRTEVLRATRELKRSLAEARQFGFVGRQLEAELLLGKVEMRSANPDRAMAALAALERDAAGKGFLLIARHAHTAAGR